MNLLYQKLAEVEILHDYFTDGRCTVLKAMPSKESARALMDAGIVWRMIGHKLVILAKVGSNGKLRRALPPGLALRFYLATVSGSFFTISNLGFNASGTQRYLFSNRSGTSNGDALFLTQPIADYDGAAAYMPGDLVRFAGNLFEAVRPSGGDSLVHGVGEADWWMAKDAGQYTSLADLSELTGTAYPFPLTSPAASITTAIWGENAETGALDVVVRTADTVNWGEEQTATNISLAGLPAGRYRIEVNSESRTVFFDEEAVARKVFAVLEIQTGLPESHTHGLFAANGTLRSPHYVLRFPARKVHWKYIARTADVQDIFDTNETVSARHHFDPTEPRQFLSSKPIALREAPITTLALDSAQLGEVAPIASASPYKLSTCTVDGDVLLCSEIRLNH